MVIIIKLNLSTEVVEALRARARKRGTSMTEVLRKVSGGSDPGTL